MRKRIWKVFILSILVISFSGCEALDVLKDILSVNDVDTSKADGPKIMISQPTESPDQDDPVVITLTPTPTEAAEEEKEWVYCISPVNVRSGPGNQEAILGSLETGQRVERLGEERSWVKIDFEGQEGWVYGKYLSDEPQ